MKTITYPFIPKSTAYMIEGQIISIPISNGKYACGRVLQFNNLSGKRDSRSFIVGLMNWCGTVSPVFDSIAGLGVIDHGAVHVKTIRECGAEIVGFRPLSLDGITIPLTLDEAPGKNCHLRQGFHFLDLASDKQQKELQVFSTWGYMVLKIKAEKYFL